MNHITAFFKGRVGVAESLYQYDYGMVLVLDGAELPATFDGWFETQNSEEAIPVIGAENRITIPNECLTQSGKVTLHVPIHTGDNDSEVEYTVTFRVIGRARPVDDLTPVQESALSQAIAKLLAAEARVDSKVDGIDEVIEDYFEEHIAPTVAPTVTEWLDEHPEATTTVEDGSLTTAKYQDGSITEAKLNDNLKLYTLKDYVTPEMYGALGDGEHNDGPAIQAAIDSGKPVLLKAGKTYYVDGTWSPDITITGDCPEFRNLGTILYWGFGYAITFENVWHKTHYLGTIDASASGSSEMGCVLINGDNYSSAYLNLHFEDLKVSANRDDGRCITITQDGHYINEIRFIGGRLHEGRYGVYIQNGNEDEQHNHFIFENVGFEGPVTGVYLDNMITQIMFYGCRMEETTVNFIETNPSSPANVYNRVYWYSGRLAPDFLKKCYNYIVYIFGDTSEYGGSRLNKPLIYCNGCWYGSSYEDVGAQIILPDAYISYGTGSVVYNLAGYFASSNAASSKRYIRCAKTTDAGGNAITAISVKLGLNMFSPANGALGVIGNKFKLYLKVPAGATVTFLNGDGTSMWTKTNSGGPAEWYFDIYNTANWGASVEFQTSDQIRLLGVLNNA